ncbi:V-type proton ATPase subunit S1 [Tribolium madens]|uniref:V-type proton ATPase subunit S1 n=1 Tax=Tribolium madens TaxID=41895 RepID=UPI001CF74957|nr:V-type proton ATPase subunit S1 [Tribolium madens]
MALYYNILIFVITVLSINLVSSAEFVPVYMWGTTKLSERVPALHKISQDSFKDTLLEYLKEDPYIIVFVEPTLSPEDFAQHDQNGEIAFPNLHGLKKLRSHVAYKPYVQNPVKAVKQLNKEVTELSIGSLLSSSNVPKDNILIIDLNDAKDDEPRFHMLKRHDSDIVSIYKDILEQRNNVLAIYTANHTSWIAPEDITHSRSRSLLQLEDSEEKKDTGIRFSSAHLLLYLSDKGSYKVNKDTSNITIDNSFMLSETSDMDNKENITATLSGSSLSINFAIKVNNVSGYWYLTSMSVKTDKENQLVGISDYFAPRDFSYHCSTFNLSTVDRNATLSLPGFQIQPFPKNNTFGDAYDCVGFTSVPIWSGLFVTIILLLIVTFGLTMMMDIKTMDRFDDPKGKTITITASE